MTRKYQFTYLVHCGTFIIQQHEKLLALQYTLPSEMRLTVLQTLAQQKALSPSSAICLTKHNIDRKYRRAPRSDMKGTGGLVNCNRAGSGFLVSFLIEYLQCALHLAISLQSSAFNSKRRSTVNNGFMSCRKISTDKTVNCMVPMVPNSCSNINSTGMRTFAKCLKHHSIRSSS